MLNESMKPIMDGVHLRIPGAGHGQGFSWSPEVLQKPQDACLEKAKFKWNASGSKRCAQYRRYEYDVTKQKVRPR